MKMRELLAEAAKYGASVHLSHIDDRPRLLGYYDPKRHIIVIRIGMTMRETRAAIAHEVSHLALGHACTNGRNEHRARAMSAAMMIRSDDYARAEVMAEDQHQLADELDVPAWMIRDYQQHCLKRIGKRTYVGERRVADQSLD